MEINDFYDLILTLKEKEIEKGVWETWIARLPFMEMGYLPPRSFIEMMNEVNQQEPPEQASEQGGLYVDQIFF